MMHRNINFTKALNDKQKEIIDLLIDYDFVRDIKGNIKIEDDYCLLYTNNKKLKITFYLFIPFTEEYNFDFVIGIDKINCLNKLKQCQILFYAYKNIKKRTYRFYMKLLRNHSNFKNLNGTFSYIYQNYW